MEEKSAPPPHTSPYSTPQAPHPYSNAHLPLPTPPHPPSYPLATQARLASGQVELSRELAKVATRTSPRPSPELKP